MLERLILFLLLAVLPDIVLSVPIVSMSSFQVALYNSVTIKQVDGTYLEDIDFQDFAFTPNANMSTSRYANIDGDTVGFFADANFTSSFSHISMMSGAEINWDGGAYNPNLPDAQLDGSSIFSAAELTSAFTVSDVVKFTGQVINYAGHNDTSFGAVALYDTTFGHKNILNIWDNSTDSFVRESVFLQPNHTYFLDAVTANSTGADEEIYTDFWFEHALLRFNLRKPRFPLSPVLMREQMSPSSLIAQTESMRGMSEIAVPNPPASLLFVVGLVLLGAVKLDFSLDERPHPTVR